MAPVAPRERKPLSADALFSLVRSGFAAIPDYRLSETDISLTDALMAAFALFSLKSPSLLAFDKHRVEGHWGTIYAIGHVPCDTQMREILDPVSPESVRPLFKSVFGQLQRGKALESMMFLEDYYLLALDGTEYCSSKTIHCASCLHKVHRNGSITYDHQMLGAALVHPPPVLGGVGAGQRLGHGRRRLAEPERAVVVNAGASSAYCMLPFRKPERPPSIVLR